MFEKIHHNEKRVKGFHRYFLYSSSGKKRITRTEPVDGGIDRIKKEDMNLQAPQFPAAGSQQRLSIGSQGGRNKVNYVQCGLFIQWVKVFRIIREFRILRLTFHRKSASKCYIRQIIMASLIYFQFILGQLTILLEIINDL